MFPSKVLCNRRRSFPIAFFLSHTHGDEIYRTETQTMLRLARNDGELSTFCANIVHFSALNTGS